MPCYDERNSPSYVREETAKEVRRDCRHNSDVAELLCTTLKALGVAGRGQVLPYHPDVAKWWAEHQTRDAAKAKKPKRK